MKIVCISGKARHGKDTLAGFLKDCFEERGERVLIAHYGDLVKYVCKTFFGWDGKKDEQGRTLLQRVGTDTIRAKDQTFWVDFVVDILGFFPDEWDWVLIPDCRFPDEITRMYRLRSDTTQVYNIRINRENFQTDLTEEQQAHPSETALDDYAFELTITNRGTLDDLRKTAEWIADYYFRAPR